ncbi:CDGSH iron-sulfur domain-containing protein [Streptomyces sp. NPDC047002]|uniref:CDGSH iron-sulfur domain-containing protein n=1 Tax=Streptomyces sp. NPDC047002 TaxID=3155475 RepID=UPI0034527CC8
MNPSPDPARRVTLEPGGPLLLEGPVDVAVGDDTVAHSDRPVVAVCTCRRSRRYPWCDTSHRRRARRPGGGQRDGREQAADGGAA